MRFTGKTAVVTGARSGIGRATARRFAEEGAQVVLADIREADGEARALTEAGHSAIAVQADVSDEGQVAELMEQALATYGRIDILVNNAGVELTKTVADTTLAEWDHLMAVNLRGVFLCCRAVLPAMRRQGRGVIVNVASELALVGGSEMAAYSASKGGVVQLTRAMAVDHAAEGVRVNCVAPGPVATRLLDAIIGSAADPQAERRSITDNTLLKRLGQPGEIAGVVLFLACDDATYMTGSVVVADGGWTAH